MVVTFTKAGSEFWITVSVSTPFVGIVNGMIHAPFSEPYTNRPMDRNVLGQLDVKIRRLHAGLAKINGIGDEFYLYPSKFMVASRPGADFNQVKREISDLYRSLFREVTVQE